MTDVALFPCADYTPDACRAALAAVLQPFGALDWVRPGMRVGVKVNLVAAMKPENGGTTHPALLCALAQLLTERGAVPIFGDSPGGLFTPSYVGHVYSVCGLQAVEACGGQLNRDFSTVELDNPAAVAAKHFTATGWLRDCDAIINFCKLKSHGMMGLSCAAKNLFGTIPGTMKPEYHFRYPQIDDFADMLLDLDDYWKPQLHLCDAVVAMEGNGPTAGTPKPMGLVLAAENPHRLDLLCARLVGLREDDVPTLQAARRRGYLPASVEDLTTNLPWEAYCCPDFELIDERKNLQFQGTGLIGGTFGKVLRRCMESRPEVQRPLCIGCAKCAQICPAKAIEMKNKLPHIRRSSCIRCFCCQEFCPKGAMQVQRPAIAKMLSRE